MGEIGEFEFEVANEGVNIYADGCFIENKKTVGKVSSESLLSVVKNIIKAWDAEML